jgi:hypothetical protein
MLINRGNWKEYAKWQHKMVSYTRRPVTMEAMKVPRIAKVMIAPKFEKNGFYQKQNLKCLGVSLELMGH